MNEQTKIKILDYATDYLFGALWWGAETFIRKRFIGWKKPKDGRERKAHPLLSLREERVHALIDTVTMLAGSSVKSPRDEKGNLVIVMDESHPEKKTVFSHDTEPGLVYVSDFLFHVETDGIYDHPETPLWERRRMWPNLIKPRLTNRESESLKAFVEHWERITQENGGYDYE